MMGATELERAVANVAQLPGLRVKAFKLTLRQAELLMVLTWPMAINQVEYYHHTDYFVRSFWAGRLLHGATVRVLP
jgi:hypothetical protein